MLPAERPGFVSTDFDEAMASLEHAEAVVELPFGSAPHECYGVYEPMMRHMEYYVDLVNKDPVAGMREYLDRFIYGPKSWTEFLDLIGIEEVLVAARAGTTIYDA